MFECLPTRMNMLLVVFKAKIEEKTNEIHIIRKRKRKNLTKFYVNLLCTISKYIYIEKSHTRATHV